MKKRFSEEQILALEVFRGAWEAAGGSMVEADMYQTRELSNDQSSSRRAAGFVVAPPVWK